MKLKLLVTIALLAASVQSYASMAGLCNNQKTQYICCPAHGGWIVGADCMDGASTYCEKDTGMIADSEPQVTILQDCKNRGGSAVIYPFFKE